MEIFYNECFLLCSKKPFFTSFQTLKRCPKKCCTSLILLSNDCWENEDVFRAQKHQNWLKNTKMWFFLNISLYWCCFSQLLIRAGNRIEKIRKIDFFQQIFRFFQFGKYTYKSSFLDFMVKSRNFSFAILPSLFVLSGALRA